MAHNPSRAAKRDHLAQAQQAAHTRRLPGAPDARASTAGLQDTAGNNAVRHLLEGSGASDIQQARQQGKPLPKALQTFMGERLHADLGQVRVHIDATADNLARRLGSRAFTVASDIFFQQGQYRPAAPWSWPLLAHELTHVLQQGNRATTGDLSLNRRDDRYEQTAAHVAQTVGRQAQPLAHPIQSQPGAPTVQRDLVAHNQEKVETLPSIDFAGGGATTLVTTSAEAARIRAALASLIASGKITEVQSQSGKQSWFAANHHKNAQLPEITQAFKDAGFTLAEKMAKALYDIHGEYLYSNQKLTTVAPFFNRTQDLGVKVMTSRSRSMTEYEIRQARRVFKDAINYGKVTIEEESMTGKIGSVGGYARTIGNTIAFPGGDSRSMALMIHELTHVWQYQKMGWSYAPSAIWAQVTEGYSYTPKDKTPDEALRDARTAGKTLYDFNLEQQGDILADYFRRLQLGRDISAYQPFVDDVAK